MADMPGSRPRRHAHVQGHDVERREPVQAGRSCRARFPGHLRDEAAGPGLDHRRAERRRRGPPGDRQSRRARRPGGSSRGNLGTEGLRASRRPGHPGGLAVPSPHHRVGGHRGVPRPAAARAGRRRQRVRGGDGSGCRRHHGHGRLRGSGAAGHGPPEVEGSSRSPAAGSLPRTRTSEPDSPRTPVSAGGGGGHRPGCGRRPSWRG
jgi:hypothetical protein